MIQTRKLGLLIFCSCAIFLVFPDPRTKRGQDEPIWSKKGTVFWMGCADDFLRCRPLKIPSPDRANLVAIDYDEDPKYPGIETVRIKVFASGKELGEVNPVGTVENELVWSPDSKAFFISGNDNANTWYHVAVHRLDDPKLGPNYITEEIEEDMVRSFPPCRAKDPIDHCEEVAAERDYFGTAGIDWIGNSSKMVVMAEVDCSSLMGGIMCAVLGYEIEVPSGRILQRMEPREFARRWQHSMAWKFHIPEPPEFQDE